MKKIRPIDLSYDLRNIGSMKNIHKDDAKNDVRTGSTWVCDTQDECKTAGCVSVSITNCIACDRTNKCEETEDCQDTTRKCGDTISKAIYCCAYTVEGDECIIDTRKCNKTDPCLVTSADDDDCHGTILCYLTDSNCSKTDICPATALDGDCIHYPNTQLTCV